ncbi:hypothetical protein C1645_831931 [Glomus cerebriforme]|uniref:Uncharacterized protein n=1 Tax=Glomus cerebriforme TaxID=658196 RepID=A0A397SEK0_9GLOM|nr:hypothetical protein C1645_831931 [Glomus cerebriforme]
MSTPNFNDFFNNTNPWSCENVVKYYWEKIAQYIIDNWKKAIEIWPSWNMQGRLVINARFVPTLIYLQWLAETRRSTGHECKYWTIDVKQSNQNDKIIQKHIAERNVLVEEHHNEILRNSLVRDQHEPRTPENKVVVFSIILIYSSQKYHLTFQIHSQIRITSEMEMEETDSDITYIKEVEKEEKQTSKYINCDIASEALGTYQMNVLADKKLIYNNVNILDSAHLIMKATKKVLSVLVSLTSIIPTAQNFYPMTLKTLSPISYKTLRLKPLTLPIGEAFLRDIKLSYGELASNSYNKLKEILNIGGHSAPRLDGKRLLKSLGTEILVQEDGALNTRRKKKGDLKKLDAKEWSQTSGERD